MINAIIRGIRYAQADFKLLSIAMVIYYKLSDLEYKAAFSRQPLSPE